MKIGVIVDNELNNDVRVLREIKLLRDQGHEIFVLCFGFSKTYTEPLSGINISRINIPAKIKDTLFFFQNTIPLYERMWILKIKNHIEKYNLDFLHVHDLYMSRAAHRAIVNSKRKIPMVLDLHENYPYTVSTYNWTKGAFRHFFSKPESWKKKEGEYLNYAEKIIVLSEEYRDLLLRTYPDLNSKNFVIVPNVPELPAKGSLKGARPDLPFENDYPVLFYYGVIAERRGIFDALEVFSRLIKEGHRVNFLLIGPVDKADRPAFNEFIKMNEIKGYIHHIPWIESSEFPAYLEICDICLAPFHKNPQHESGIANKIYEYMLGGKPVIASDCKPQQNLIEKYNCGLIFRNLNEFHDKIVILLNDKLLAERMGQNGKKAVLEISEGSFIKNKLVSLYSSNL